MTDVFATFDTAIGTCAIAWNLNGVTGVWLPEQSLRHLRARVERRLPGIAEASPTGDVAEAIAAITALLNGERTDLSGVRIDDARIDLFDRLVYAATRKIPAGRVVTYATLAARIGPPATARAVGQSLGRNPFPVVVPCHRVVAANGQLGGFSAPGGTATKRRLLAIEDARSDGGGDLFDTPDSAAPTSSIASWSASSPNVAPYSSANPWKT